jgi:3-oxoacyl-[acyl-carrier protein] reductase
VEKLRLDGIADDVVARYGLDRLPLDRPFTSTERLLRLDGKSAIVTGGGGDGLGYATCHRLAEQGASVAVVDIDEQAAGRTVSELTKQWQTEAFAVRADVGDWDQVQRAVAAVAERAGRVDLLVNNVGGSGGVGGDGRRPGITSLLAEMSPEHIETLVRINLTGVLYMTRAVLDHMLPQRSGRIINIASEGGRVGLPGSSVYSSCKAGVIGLTRTLAAELGPLGISSVCVSPGLLVRQAILTALADSAGGTLDGSFGRTTLGRMALMDDVASMVAFLASPAGEFVHGTTVSVGGGLSD